MDKLKNPEGIASELDSFFKKLVGQAKKYDGMVGEGLLLMTGPKNQPTPVGEEAKQRRDETYQFIVEEQKKYDNEKEMFLALCNQALAELRQGKPRKLVDMLSLAEKVQSLNKSFEDADEAGNTGAMDKVTEELQGIGNIYGWLGEKEISKWRKKMEDLGLINKLS